ncbi:MAG: transketolase C-terminal domain-containing protein, partial [Candidatus Micrarchaeota archaeon]
KPDVKIIGVGGGLDYAQSGSTHQATEDIAVMRSLPNMRVVCPCGPMEAAALPAALAKSPGPVYVRLGRGGEKEVLSAPQKIEIGKSMELLGEEGEGEQAVVFCTGNISKNAYDAVDGLRQKGLKVRLCAMSWVKPLDGKAISRAAKESGLIITVEEHNVSGGLYGAVCEEAARLDCRAKIRAVCLNDTFVKHVGDTEYLRGKVGLDAKSIGEKIGKWIEEG